MGVEAAQPQVQALAKYLEEPLRLLVQVGLPIRLLCYDSTSRIYYRRLPHWQPGGAIFFITFRPKGFLSLEFINALQEERERENENLLKLPRPQRMICGRKRLK